ncbi:histidine ammonia-lyase [Anaerosalibacter bizertensis]|uniref:Histidine ammonia-lyase n=1 Tax=Anaerosalibacter bizertensis TaxID=932217 RepID=A0A9Q4FLP7_9FIRM|nr:histidine ammonia-lyase [Anaerosalibacter bizertensis]MBV1818257.1 histidine ammonia-lyase [Bacteroidales bacterium MSK.15.36]MCB5560251.1 histidine ammonia-lyase [Anaerosalibacter bizertensis]MCG4565986.1 histidine ammonia-lyase [Anaerosalibacter bizertensis]MCG4583361.1 histidine ammonia-lyase [Anaerosalibacter bizertensis]MCG4584894.1 histidine ammonia-lyase [Anaerosalibacter bizertensis]
MNKVIIDGNSLTIEEFANVARNGYKVELSKEAIKNVEESRKIVDKFVEEEKVVYGITTGFGMFSDVVISKDETKKLQKNLIVSHSCGVGNPLDEEIVRGIMLLRANALAKGFSGIRLSTLNTLLEMLNRGVHPVIPEKGSLGASGDLAPLAHMVLVMLGEGEAYYKGERMEGKKAMELAEISTVQLTSKEGLALINGTQVMTSIGALAVYDSINLSKIADIASSLTIEALNGIVTAYDEKVHNVRPHNGQINTAKNLLRLLKGSNMTTTQGEIRVQDAYSLRCLPQIHGASKDAIEYVKKKVEIEINSATDNPLIFSEVGEVISGGNFHGQPMALSFDFLGIALAEIANSSERRIERMVNPALSGLPAFLVEEGGLNSGFMIVQYSAASLVSENKVLAHPASVDSIPSSANQEDHVSMGTIAARKARTILDNARKVLAMELLTACQAIDLRGNSGLGHGSNIAYDIVRENTCKVKDDIIMYKEINKCEELIKSNIILNRVEEKLGKLN